MSETRKKLDAAAFCALPLVRRAYMALVVGLAVFTVTLVVLREPFRGYLAEVRISGPAIAGLDLEEATTWLKQADHRAVVIASVAGRAPPNVLSRSDRRQSQIRMTYLAPLPTPALTRLDELAGRWLYQYLPQRLNAFRQAELRELRAGVNAARAREDEASSEVEVLRQRQLAILLRPSGGAGSGDPRTTLQELPPLPVTMIPPLPAGPEPWRERLEALRLELARLLASFTEEHPQVIALRMQIERLQGPTRDGQPHGGQPPLSQPPEGPELIPAPAADRHAKTLGRIRPVAADRLVASLQSESARTGSIEQDAAEVAKAVTAAVAGLGQASRARQGAEQRLSDRMQELSNQPTAAEWSAEPARVVTRLGGTPRSATLALGGLLATIAGVLLFRGSAVVVVPPSIESAGELASVLELPVIGNVAGLRRSGARIPWRLLTAGRVRAVVHAAEAVVAVAVLACVLSICVEPSLARQVLADPFGALSEVMGRWG